ncbi:UbiA family prenyltransferase [candidate division WOR-3 bacterium]|nr:UbiA family prenyltransferase [candidate division WOR-3 bacterium]
MSVRRLFDYLFILRPLILIPVWNFLLIGGYLARGQGKCTNDIFIGLLLYTCIMGGVYILNQIMDRETDRANKKLFLISEGHVPITHAYVEMTVLWIIGILLSLRYGSIFMIAIVISIILGVLYSLPPVKLKGKPIIDMLANAFGYGMVNFMIGWLLVSSYSTDMFYRFFPYVLSIGAVFVNTTIVDMEGDQQAGECTTAVLLGIPSAYILSTLCMAGSILWAYANRDIVCLIPACISFPLFVYLLFDALRNHRANRKLTIASFRLPGVLFTLMTIYLYPLYAVFLVALLIVMRIYFKKRFNMVYPTLSRG